MEIKVTRVGFGETVGGNAAEPNFFQSIWNGIRLAFGGVVLLFVLSIAMLFGTALFLAFVTISFFSAGLSMLFGTKNHHLRKGNLIRSDEPIFDVGDDAQTVDYEIITTPIDREDSSLYRDAEHWEDKE